MKSVMQPQDAVAASGPFLFGFTLAQINDLLGFVSLVLGIAYLIWKWRRDAKAKE